MTEKLKDRFHISQDELIHRMQLQDKLHNDHCQKAVAILEEALDTVMKKLGVNVEEDIPTQQEQLGIRIVEEIRDEMAGLQGFFVIVNLEPFAWIGNATLNHLGECSCEIHWFQEERMDEVGKVRLIQ